MAKRCSAAPFDLFRSSHDGRPWDADDVDGAAKAEPGTGGASGTALKPCTDEDEDEEEDELTWDARAGLRRGGDRRLGGDADRSRPNGASGSSIGSNSSIDGPREGVCRTEPPRLRDDDDDDDDEGGADSTLP